MTGRQSSQRVRGQADELAVAGQTGNMAASIRSTDIMPRIPVWTGSLETEVLGLASASSHCVVLGKSLPFSERVSSSVSCAEINDFLSLFQLGLLIL